LHGDAIAECLRGLSASNHNIFAVLKKLPQQQQGRFDALEPHIRAFDVDGRPLMARPGHISKGEFRVDSGCLD